MKRRDLTAAKIVDTALALADADGIEALSMRKLADALGVTAMSLYNHVSSKDALLDLMLDRVIGEIESPRADAAWDQMMRRRAHSMRQALLRHRWAAILLMSRITVGPALLRDMDATLGCLTSAGFSYAQADWARNVLDSHIYGYTLQELNFPVAPQNYKQAANHYLPLVPASDYPYAHQAARQIIDGAYDGMTDFTFGLDLILDGLQRWVARQT